LVGCIVLSLLTFVCLGLHATQAIASLLYLIVVVLISLQVRLVPSLLIAIIALFCLDYFFTPPLFALTVADPLDLVAMVAFVTTAFVVTTLMSRMCKSFQEIQAREAKIRGLVDANIIGFCVVERDGRMIEANDAFLRTLAYDRQDLLSGRINWMDLTPPEWRDRSAQAVSEFTTTGAVQPFEKEYFRKDGSRVPVLVGIASIEGTEDQRVALVLDLTERKRAEQALRRSEAYLAEGQRLTHTGSWAYNPLTGKTTYWSDEMFRIFGLDPQEGPSSEKFWLHVHPEDRHRVRERVEREAHEKRQYVDDYRIVLADGTVKHISDIGHPVFNASGNLIEFVGTTVDVTERKRAEEALQKAQAELAHVTRVTTLGELAASIAHEVNQPLGAISNNVNACRRFLAAGSEHLHEAEGALSDIVKAVDRANSIIVRMRALAKKVSPEMTQLHLEEVVTDVLSLIHHELTRRHVIIRIEAHGGRLWVAPIGGPGATFEFILQAQN
jgi:PAS domain S-box-containing protein